MNDVIGALTATRDFFTRAEALRAGLTDKDLQRLVRTRQLHRVRHGSYVPGTLWGAADSLERHRLHCRAVAHALGGRAALSHVSAAATLGLDVWGADLSRVHVTRLDGASGSVRRDVVHHTGRLGGDQLLASEGPLVTGPITGPTRTVLDHAGLAGVQSGLVTADSALRNGSTNLEELQALYDWVEGWPHMGKVRLVLRMADGRAASVGETRTRYLFWRHGIPRPELQYEVRDEHGRLIGITDFAWPEYGLLGEFDGRVKYGRLLRPGQDAGDVVFAEKVREDQLREVTTWRMIRFIWADLETGPVTAARTRRSLLAAA